MRHAAVDSLNGRTLGGDTQFHETQTFSGFVVGAGATKEALIGVLRGFEFACIHQAIGATEGTGNLAFGQIAGSGGRLGEWGLGDGRGGPGLGFWRLLRKFGRYRF